ncbi:hypothetical protein INR49_003775 [Caranx melampygus]|nr:hypothetical protein INR49_003775 [Caranx melampygus]
MTSVDPEAQKSLKATWQPNEQNLPTLQEKDGSCGADLQEAPDTDGRFCNLFVGWLVVEFGLIVI